MQVISWIFAVHWVLMLALNTMRDGLVGFGVKKVLNLRFVAVRSVLWGCVHVFGGCSRPFQGANGHKTCTIVTTALCCIRRAAVWVRVVTLRPAMPLPLHRATWCVGVLRAACTHCTLLCAHFTLKCVVWP